MSEYSFSFSSQGYAADTFAVLNFEGSESVSQCYALNIEVACDDTNLDAQALLQESCSLAVLFDGESVKQFHGILETYEEISRFEDRVIYQLRLVPRLWQLGLTTTNEVYLEQNIQTTLELILQEAGFTADIDFRFALAKSYRKWPFRLQYKETYLDFIQRVIEREGIYYFFEQNEQAETLVFCDNNADIPSASPIPLRFQLQGAVQVDPEPVFTQFICRQSRVPHKVVLRDFNEASPSLDVKGEAIINEDQKRSTGEINIYGLNILDVEEGEALAEIHASAYRCRQTEYSAVGDVAVLSAGHSFKMSGHPSKKLNEGRYIVDSIHHQGNNGTFVLNESYSSEQVSAYTNQAIVLDLANTYGVQANAHKPEINGTLNAVIDAEGDGEYAELDDFGRYLVKLPFDRRDSEGGKDSCWVRMMQPSGGVGSGMHFPLLKGTRVLLSFIGGDPDRPVISGTIGDLGEQSSIVNNENQTNSMIKTHSGNKIEIEDKEGTQRIKLETPHENTYFHLGAPNHDGSGVTTATTGMTTSELLGGSKETKVVRPRIRTGAGAGAYSFGNKNMWEKDISFGGIGDNNATLISGAENGSASSNQALLNERDIHKFKVLSRDGDGNVTGFRATDLTEIEEDSGLYHISRRWGDQYTWTDGDNYNIGNGSDFNFGTGHTENWVGDEVNNSNFPDGLIVHDTAVGYMGKIGDSNAVVEKTYGNVFEFVHGDVLSKSIGAVDEWVEGPAHRVFAGTSDDIFLGMANNIWLGGSTEVYCGAAVDIKVAIALEIFLGGIVEVSGGWSSELELVGRFKLRPVEQKVGISDFEAATSKIETLVSSTKAQATKISAVASETKANGQKISAIGSKVDSNASAIQANASAIQTAATEIKTTAAQIENGLTATNNMVNEVSARVSKIENGATKLKFCGLEVSF
jgi:type VI secretion system VgrG family protein